MNRKSASPRQPPLSRRPTPYSNNPKVTFFRPVRPIPEPIPVLRIVWTEGGFLRPKYGSRPEEQAIRDLVDRVEQANPGLFDHNSIIGRWGSDRPHIPATARDTLLVHDDYTKRLQRVTKPLGDRRGLWYQGSIPRGDLVVHRDWCWCDSENIYLTFYSVGYAIQQFGYCPKLDPSYFEKNPTSSQPKATRGSRTPSGTSSSSSSESS